MSTAHSIALGLLIAIGLLSVVGFVQLLMRPFDIAFQIMCGVGEEMLRAKEAERAYRKRIEFEVARLEMRGQLKKEVPDGRG